MTDDDTDDSGWWPLLAVCVLLLLLPFFSLGYAFATVPRASTFGLALVALAVVMGALNFSLSFVRPFLFRRQHGSLEGLSRASTVPLISTLFAVVGSLVGFASVSCAALTLASFLIDTGGPGWLLFSFARHARSARS